MKNQEKHEFYSNYHALSTYATAAEIEKVLRSKSEQISFACYALHDKDKTPEGKDKEPHTHVLLFLKKSRKSTQVIDWFKCSLDSKGEIANTMDEPVKSTTGAYEYLTHKNDDTKYQYEEHVIKVSVGKVADWLEMETPAEAAFREAERAKAKAQAQADDINNEIDDLINNVPLRTMAQRYGRDFIKNYRSYRDFALMVSCQETGDIPDHLLNGVVEREWNEKIRTAAEYAQRETMYTMVNAFRDVLDEVCGEAVSTQVYRRVQRKLAHEEAEKGE